MGWVPGQPRALTGNGQYALEHILVTEEMPGRYLLLEENVHHRNGIRDDNRPEHLELCTKASVQWNSRKRRSRWAYRIPARYGDQPSRLQEGRFAWACEAIARNKGNGGTSNIAQAFD
jgi:HNH endonuclease